MGNDNPGKYHRLIVRSTRTNLNPRGEDWHAHDADHVIEAAGGKFLFRRSDDGELLYDEDDTLTVIATDPGKLSYVKSMLAILDFEVIQHYPPDDEDDSDDKNATHNID